MKDSKAKSVFFGILTGFGTISLSVLFFFFLYKINEIGLALDKLYQILAPIIYGGVIAYLLRPICKWLYGKLQKLFPKMKHRTADLISVALSLFFGLLVVYALIAILVPQLYYSILNIWDTLPDKADAFVANLQEKFTGAEALIDFFDQGSAVLYQAADNWIKNTVMPNLSNIVSNVGMSVWKVLLFLKNILIGVIIAAYLLGNRFQFKRQATLLLNRIFKPKWAKALAEEAAFIDSLFGGFISGKLVDSAIIGVLCYIGCSIFRFPNALLVSAIVGVTNVIPFFGPVIGAVPSVMLILIENPIKAVWFSLFVLGLQQLDGNIIGPKILGNHTGVSSFWVLFSILLFGGLWGLVGMIVAVPLFAVLYDLLKRLVKRGLTKNGCADVLDRYNEDYHAELTEVMPEIPKENQE